jgi:hypothetical protein
MPSLSRFSLFSSTALAAFAAGAAAQEPVRLDAAGLAHLQSLQRAPESAGTLIYRGTVFAQRAPDGTPLFSYERRVGRTASGLSSAHITHTPGGEVLIAEQAQFSADYALARFDATNRQLGYSGSVVLSQGGRHLEYRLVEGERVSTASEDVSDPVVSGPSLHGFILHHWDALGQGKRLPVRMIVMAKKTTYGFDIRRFGEADGRTAFSITPSNWLLRLAIAPLMVTFDSSSRNVLRYEGRVPPMRAEGGKLKALDARVDYAMHVPVYR